LIQRTPTGAEGSERAGCATAVAMAAAVVAAAGRAGSIVRDLRGCQRHPRVVVRPVTAHRRSVRQAGIPARPCQRARLSPKPAGPPPLQASVASAEGTGGSDSEPGGNIEWAKWLGGGAAAILLTLAAVWGVTGHTPVSLVQAFFRLGFAASFTLVFVSEIGDKTFFMAGICAMRVGRLKAFLGAALALAVMTAISVAIGVLFKQVPDAFTTSLPVAEYIAVALLIYFGIRAIRDAWALPDENTGEEYEEASETISQAEKDGRVEKGSSWKTVLEVASLVFAAEWGDRSMLAIIALAAGGTNALCVGIGALSGHFAATLIAVFGGALIGKHVSDKMIGYAGGALFLLFAALTVLGIC